MLVIKAYVNYREIETIHIQNVGETSKDGIYNYLVRQPEVKGKIKHIRKDGWIPLAIKALKKIQGER